MNLIQVIDTKDPRKFTFKSKHIPLLEEVEMSRKAVSFMRGLVEECLHDDSLSEEEFNLIEYIRLTLADNMEQAVDKANYYAREANRVLTEDEV